MRATSKLWQASAVVLAAAIASTADTASAGQATGVGLEEVVVTAQRREERLQDVPIAVTAITAAVAEKQGVRTVDDIQTATPALTITRVNQTPLFYLRGVGTQNQLPNEEPSIPLYIDGFYASTGAGAALALNNIERVEVLRGPQGTLFGRNGTGGLINIITRTPRHEPSGTASIGYGNYNTIDAGFYGTTGLTESLAADLSLYYSKRSDGFGRNVLLNNDVGLNKTFAVRSKLLFTPTDETTVTLSADYSKTRSDYGMTTQIAEGITGFDNVTRNAGNQNISQTINPYTTPKDYSATGRLDQDLGFARFVNLTQYRHNRTYYQKDVDGLPVNRGTAQQREYTWVFSEEAQLQSQSDGRLQWVAGVFYLKSGGGVDPLVIGGNQFGAALNSQIRYGAVKTKSYAGFGQATLEITDTTRLTLGGRWTHDQKNLSGQVINVLPSGAQVVSVPTPPGVTQLKTSRFTYRVALDQKLTEDIMAYAVVSRGYKAGSFNVLAIVDPPIQPETLNSIEGGVKSEFFDRRLRLNAAAYHYKYKNIQLSQLFSATAGGSGGIKILNATSAKIWGLELDAQAQVTDAFTLTANFAYTHGRYGSFPGAPFSVPPPGNCPGVATPVPLNSRNTQCTADASGHEVVRTPPVTFTIVADYQIPLADGKLGLNGSVYYNDGFPWEVDNRLRQSAYTLVNADVRWTSPGDRYAVRLWVRNLTDKKYNIGISTSNNDQIAPGAPRTYGVGLIANF